MKLSRATRWMIGGGAVLLCLIVLMVNKALFFKLVSLGATALLVLSIVVMLLTFRKKRRITPGPLVISMAMSLASLLVYTWILNVHFSNGVTLAGLGFGALLGVGWALTTPVRATNGIVEREGNLWYLAAWGAIFVLNQLTLILTGRPPRIAMLLLLLGTGTVLGNSLSYIVSYYTLRARAR